MRDDLQDLEWTSENVRVSMTHIGEYTGHYDRRAKRELARHPPGVATHQSRRQRPFRWHMKRTALRLDVEAGNIENGELLELGRAAAKRRRSWPELEALRDSFAPLTGPEDLLQEPTLVLPAGSIKEVVGGV